MVEKNRYYLSGSVAKTREIHSLSSNFDYSKRSNPLGKFIKSPIFAALTDY
jgi:hypothetical protein